MNKIISIFLLFLSLSLQGGGHTFLPLNMTMDERLDIINFIIIRNSNSNETTRESTSELHSRLEPYRFYFQEMNKSSKEKYLVSNDILGVAVSCNDFEAVKYLLDIGVDIDGTKYYKNIKTSNEITMHPLINAILKDNFQITRLLINKGANVNGTCSENIYKSDLEEIETREETPLFFAVFYDRLDIINLLLENNVKISELVVNMINNKNPNMLYYLVLKNIISTYKEFQNYYEQFYEFFQEFNKDNKLHIFFNRYNHHKKNIRTYLEIFKIHAKFSLKNKLIIDNKIVRDIKINPLKKTLLIEFMDNSSFIRSMK